MIIVSLAFAYWAFLIAYNMLPKLWVGVVVAIATFAATMIATTFDVLALLVIIIGALLALTLLFVIGKK